VQNRHQDFIDIRFNVLVNFLLLLLNHIDTWYNEQLLNVLAKSTADCYRSRVLALLKVYPKPTELDIEITSIRSNSLAIYC